MTEQEYKLLISCPICLNRKPKCFLLLFHQYSQSPTHPRLHGYAASVWLPRVQIIWVSFPVQLDLFLILKSFLSYASQADCLFWRAELAFYVSACLLQSCPTPTWSSINIPEKKKCFLNPILQGSKGLFYVQSSEIKKPNPSKIASFCILHFDDVSKVWFSIFFMLLIYSKLPYISVVPNRKEVTCKGTGPPVT